VITEVFASDEGAGWTIKFWYDAHRAHGVIGYALFFILFALFLERTIFERLERRAFKWRPKDASRLVVEKAFDEMGAQGDHTSDDLVTTERATGDLSDRAEEKRG
jgi:hypothetical protein